MADTPPSINLAQIVALLVIGYFAVQAVRSYLSPRDVSQAGAPGTTSRRANNGSRVNPAHVEQVAQMFPQLDRRTIMWDLQRNGGSVQATTERVLTGRGLEAPPPSFRPPIAQTSTTSSSQSRPKVPKHPDLITRYNLSSKISSPEAASSLSSSLEGDGTKRAAWSSNKADRQANLQQRRNEMILAARRKMEEKERAKEKDKASNTS